VLISRPVVRSFHARFERECAAWVRRGGHGVLWSSPEKARLVIPRPDPKNEKDFGRWAVLDLGKSAFGIRRKGLLRGLATTPVPSDALFVVREWATRDSIHRGPRRQMSLDCLECGACCRDNEVILQSREVKRFDKKLTRRKDGHVMLRLAPNKKCVYLARDNKCGVYAKRPKACSEFPVGSECCLYSREEELGIFDGPRPPS
jgi:hypothetical protein